MIIYGLKNCDTCRKALKALDNAVLVDVREDGLPEQVRDRALALFGDRLVNTRSTTWRQLDESERQKPAQDLLAASPALMKRPLISEGNALHLGWGPETRKALGVG